MLAGLAIEDRLFAAFDLRRLRTVIAQSGWRSAALLTLTAVRALPLTPGLRHHRHRPGTPTRKPCLPDFGAARKPPRPPPGVLTHLWYLFALSLTLVYGFAETCVEMAPRRA